MTSASLRLGLGGAGREAYPARNANVACQSSPVSPATRFAHASPCPVWRSRSINSIGWFSGCSASP
jgi:hypothetical protein